MISTLHRNRWVFVGLALLAACFAEMARGAEPSENDVYSARLKARYRIATVKSISFMVLVKVDADSPLRALPVDLDRFDIIMAMDKQELDSPAAVESHYGSTPMTLIDNAANQVRNFTIDLPPLASQGNSTAPRRMLGVYGVTNVLPIRPSSGPAGYPGLQITGLVPNGPAQRAGLRNGMMIAKINDERVYTMDGVREALANWPLPNIQVLVYYPNGTSSWVSVWVGE